MKLRESKTGELLFEVAELDPHTEIYIDLTVDEYHDGDGLSLDSTEYEVIRQAHLRRMKVQRGE